MKITLQQMLLAQSTLDATIQNMRFALCPACGNEQPYETGQVVPDCESCGQPLSELKEAA